MYLNLVEGNNSTLMVLGDHLRVEKGPSLFGDLKATLGTGILG